MVAATKAEVIEVDGREVRVSNPDKVYFPQPSVTKMELVEYYLSVAEGALRGCLHRPTLLYRWPNGVEGDPFYQKRIPDSRPEWLDSATITFPSGRSAVMLAPSDAAHIVWAINLGCIDLNPWPVRADDVDHPDELRVDLDPTPDTSFADVRRVAGVVREVLADLSLTGFPKTSGKRGIHVYVRIQSRWGFSEVRKSALAFAREVERRVPALATTAWWKEERHGVFVDYNQNARDRTIASVYSVRPVANARVSCPLVWDEVADVEPDDLNVRTVPDRFRSGDDPAAGIDDVQHSLDGLLELSARQEAEGREEAPLPPHFPKGEKEPPRVQPSRKRKRDASG